MFRAKLQHAESKSPCRAPVCRRRRYMYMYLRSDHIPPHTMRWAKLEAPAWPLRLHAGTSHHALHARWRRSAVARACPRNANGNAKQRRNAEMGTP